MRQGHKAALARKLAERQADVRAKQEQLPATEQACNRPDTSGSLHDTAACLDRAIERGQSSALLQWMLNGPGCKILAGAHPRAGTHSAPGSTTATRALPRQARAAPQTPRRFMGMACATSVAPWGPWVPVSKLLLRCGGAKRDWLATPTGFPGSLGAW